MQTTKVQISMHICTPWSPPLLFYKFAGTQQFLQLTNVPSEDSEKLVKPHSLIRVFAGRTMDGQRPVASSCAVMTVTSECAYMLVDLGLS